MIWVEPSGACNLDCPECPTAVGRGGGVMHISDFNNLLENTPWVKLLNLWHRGEPLMAPDLPDMIAEATRRGIRTQTHTNGILLSRRDTADRLIEAGLTRISVGIDGADENSYRQMRRGGSLAEVEAGVRAVVEARKKYRMKKPRIIAECLLSNQTHEQLHAVDNIARHWGCDEVKFKTMRVESLHDLQDAASRLPVDRKFWRYNQVNGHLEMKRTRKSCRRLAHSAVVAWNGDVLPCCFDARGQYLFGNAFNDSFVDIWRGEPFRRFRYRVNHQDRDQISICRNCTEGLEKLYMPRKQVLN